MTFDRVHSLWWGPNVHSVFPSEKNIWCGDDDAFWAPYGESLNSFIAGHKKKKKMKLFFVTDCESLVRSMALGHVVGRCDKTKMRRAFLSILHLLTGCHGPANQQPVSPPLDQWHRHTLHIVTSWQCGGWHLSAKWPQLPLSHSAGVAISPRSSESCFLKLDLN